MLVIGNHQVLVPATQERSYFKANSITGPGTERLANVVTGTLNNQTEFALPFRPLSVDWVEVYINQLRVINPVYLTRHTAAVPTEAYTFRNGNIVFSQPQTGSITVISDTIVNPLPETTANVSLQGLIIEFDNIQSYDRFEQRFTPYRYAVGYDGNTVNSQGWSNTQLRARVGVALYSEPIVLRQPDWGYVRVTQNRRNLLYVPPRNFRGNDSFSYTMITQHGQIGPPRCIRIEVVQPSPPRTLTLATSRVRVPEGNLVVITLTSVGYVDGTEFDYSITGTNITVNDFYNRDIIPGTYSIVGRYADNKQTASTVANAQTLSFELSSQLASEELFYTVEPSAAAAELNIRSLTGKFRVNTNSSTQIGTDSFTAAIFPDYVDEGDEIFTVALTNFPSVRVSVTIEDLLAQYRIQANITVVDDDSVMEFAVSSRFVNELLYFTIENADGSPITYIPLGYTITAVKL